MSTLVLQAENLSVGYGHHAVAKGISFTVHQGDYVAIVGENGAGKTTLMHTILGLGSPISGSLVFGPEFSSEKIGWLPQQKEIQKDFPASVYEVVLSGCRSDFKTIFYQHTEKKRAKRAMEALGIGNLGDCSYRKLSGGQQQRTLLARALCSSEGLLMLDEPVTGLDPETSALMYELILKLNQECQTILMVTHDVSVAERYASHILRIGDHCTFQNCSAEGRGEVSHELV